MTETNFFDEEWSDLVEIIANGITSDEGVKLTQKQCVLLAMRLKTSVDLESMVNTMHKLISSTLIDWRKKL